MFFTQEPQKKPNTNSLQSAIENDSNMWWVIATNGGDVIHRCERYSFSYQLNTNSNHQSELTVKFGIRSAHPNPFNASRNFRIV